MKKNKTIVIYDNEEPPRDYIKEKIGGHPSIEELDYEQYKEYEYAICY